MKEKNIPVIPVLNKIDIRENSDHLATYIEEQCKIHPLLISAKEKIGIELIRQAILEKLPSDFGQQSITGELVTENDLVLFSNAAGYPSSQGQTDLTASADYP